MQAGVEVACKLQRQGLGQRLAAAEHQAHAAAQPALLLTRVAGEDRQHRRHEMQASDAVPFDRLHQRLRIAVRVRFGHHQPGADHQRPEEFPYRDIEAARRFLQHHVGRAKPVFVLHPFDAVDDRTVRHQHALRPAGGAGGVKQIGWDDRASAQAAETVPWWHFPVPVCRRRSAAADPVLRPGDAGCRCGLSLRDGRASPSM